MSHKNKQLAVVEMLQRKGEKRVECLLISMATVHEKWAKQASVHHKNMPISSAIVYEKR